MYKGEKEMLEKITEIIAEQLDVDAASITAATSFKDDLEADSLDLFELIMAVEEEYGVEIPTEDLESELDQDSGQQESVEISSENAEEQNKQSTDSTETSQEKG